MLHRRRRLALLALPVLAAALASCGGGDGPSQPEPVGPPSVVDAAPGSTTSSVAGNTVSTVTVRVRDARGRGVANERVSFEIAAGNGTLADTVAVTNASGVATVPAWTLPRSAGSYTIQAKVGSLRGTIQLVAASDFQLDVRFFGNTPAMDQQQLFLAAARRIRGLITGAVPQVNVPNQNIASLCNASGAPVLNEVVPGMIVYAAVDSIDGRGKVLAQAGGCLIRKYAIGKDSITLPLVGIMIFDRDDWQTMISQGNLQDVITHEMLHLVGVGRSMWTPKGLLRGAGTLEVAFTGTRAIQACNEAQGVAFCSSGVPVENTGGSGTADTHWRKTTFGPEIMTGYADRCPSPPAPCSYPLSGITIGALQDIGYTVNFLAADPYVLPATARARVMPAEPGEPWEKPRDNPVYEVLPNGTVRRVPSPVE